jgi:hypothetical protein
MSAVSFLRSLRVLVAPHVPDGEYGLRLDNETFSLRFANGVVQVSRGQPANPQATLSGDVTTVRSALLSGGSVRELESGGSLTITGDRDAALRLPALFRIPPAA